MLLSILLHGGKGINGLLVNPRLHILFIIAIFLLSALTMGSVHEWAEDEPYYMIAADHMEQGGSLLVPTYAHGFPRFPKPILFYWLVLLSYKIFGVSVFASRVPALISSAVVLYFTYRLSSERGSRPAEGITAVYILASFYLFYFHGKASTTDMTLTAFMISGFCLLSEFLQEKGSSKSIYLGALAFGLAGLTKGPVALVLVALTVIPFFVIGKRRGDTIPSTGQILVSVLIMSAVSGWWYMYMTAKFWPGFIEHQLGHEVVSRMDGFFWVRLKQIIWYFRRIVEAGYPWTLLVLFTVSMRVRPTDSRIPRILAWCGLIATILFYGLLIDTKRSRYLEPVLPLIALILSDYITAAFRSVKLERLAKNILRALVVFTFIITIIVSVILLAAARQDITVGLYLKVGLFTLISIGLTILLWNRRLLINSEVLTAVVAISMVFTYTYSTLVFLGTLKRTPMIELAEQTYRLPEDSRVNYSVIMRRDLFSGLMYFFGNRNVLMAENDSRDETHRIISDKEFDGLKATDEIVAEAYNYSRGINVNLKESIRNGDLFRKLPRDNYYLVRVSQ